MNKLRKLCYPCFLAILVITLSFVFLNFAPTSNMSEIPLDRHLTGQKFLIHHGKVGVMNLEGALPTDEEARIIDMVSSKNVPRCLAEKTGQSCGYDYEKNHFTSSRAKKCRLEHRLPRTGKSVYNSVDFYTNCGSCEEALAWNSWDSEEGPLQKLYGKKLSESTYLIKNGNKIDPEHHSFKVITLEAKTCSGMENDFVVFN